MAEASVEHTKNRNSLAQDDELLVIIRKTYFLNLSRRGLAAL